MNNTEYTIGDAVVFKRPWYLMKNLHSIVTITIPVGTKGTVINVDEFINKLRFTYDKITYTRNIIDAYYRPALSKSSEVIFENILNEF